MFDAHCHDCPSELSGGTCILNGTCPDDWEAAIQRAADDTHAIAAIGLHPWKIGDVGENWKDSLLEMLDQAGAIGEIGLDHLDKSVDHAQQEAAFCWQLELAAERNLPVSIHCLKAENALMRILKKQERPARGVHLHGFSGSAEQASQFAELGTYFSFHAGQLGPTARKAPEAIKIIPSDQLLVETDAPDTIGNDDHYDDFLRRAYERMAVLRSEELEDFQAQISANFKRYFLDE